MRAVLLIIYVFMAEVLFVSLAVATPCSFGSFQACHDQAADRDGKAQKTLGLMYLQGQGAVQSDHDAIRWLSKAASQGDSYAQYYLAYMFSSGLAVEINNKEALKWYAEAARQGGTMNQNRLGWLYADAHQYERAYKWFNMAAHQGNTNGIYYRDAIVRKMTVDQFKHALTLVEYKRKKY